MFGRGITNDAVFIDRVLATMRGFMADDGQQFVYQRFIAPASRTVTFAESLNRSVTGSMNDLVNHAKLWLVGGEISPHDVGVKINDILLSALAPSKKDGYGTPSKVFKTLADYSVIDTK